MFVDIAGVRHGRCPAEVVGDHGGVGECLLGGGCGQRSGDGAGGGDGVGVGISIDRALIHQVSVRGDRGTGGGELSIGLYVHIARGVDTGVEGLQGLDVGDQGDLDLVAGEPLLARAGQDQRFILVVGQVTV